MARRSRSPRQVDTFTHDQRRTNIPNAEDRALMDEDERSPIRVEYERRNPDLDPQLVWRGKSEAPLEVNAPPLYIQERIHPKALIADLMTRTEQHTAEGDQLDFFADFNGLPEGAERTEFYEHDSNWANRMILGDSLQVMGSLAEREGLRGQVQCIYIDPPYGIKFNSNFQWSTTSRDVRDGKREHITREPEQVRAFRDTWRDGIHSYLTYLRDRLEVARDLLSESGSIFVQIGDENVHRVRAVMDEVFGEDNFVSQISFTKTMGATSSYLSSTSDTIVWFARNYGQLKYRQLWRSKFGGGGGKDALIVSHYRKAGSIRTLENSAIEQSRFVTLADLTSQSGSARPLHFRNRTFTLQRGSWKTNDDGLTRLDRSSRLALVGNTPRYVRFADDFQVFEQTNLWAEQLSEQYKNYVVQTATEVVKRCILMTTDPGDLVLDPTCGSGTTAYVAEQWGRRWITIDTSRVALALARARLMGARYPWYLLADSVEGQRQEAEVTRRPPSDAATYGELRRGFVYQRVPHITLRDIANNAEIDVIWERFQEELEPLRAQLNAELGQSGEQAWEEWEIPREADSDWSEAARRYHAEWWERRIARQGEIDASIAAQAGFEYLYDQPYEDKRTVRVAGPFTVESLSPHRMLDVDEDDELIDRVAEARYGYGEAQDFASIILDNLSRSGVQQAHKEDRIAFSSLSPWPGHFICAEGRYEESGKTKRAGIFIGPEFGTVTRSDLVEAARETAESGFDALVACAFAYEAHTTEFARLGAIPVLKARMNPDLHMAGELKNTGSGNLFVIFGEPDIDIFEAGDPHPGPLPEGEGERSGPLPEGEGERSGPLPEGEGERSGPLPEGEGERSGPLPEGEGEVGAPSVAPRQLPRRGSSEESPLPSGERVRVRGLRDQLQVRVNGVDVFDPSKGEVRSDGPEGIACWFVDTDYNGESFFVRHAYFLGQNDPYKSLKTTLKAEIDEEAWSSLHSDVSRPFDRPASGRIAVKVINHLGDEVMKVFRTE